MERVVSHPVRVSERHACIAWSRPGGEVGASHAMSASSKWAARAAGGRVTKAAARQRSTCWEEACAEAARTLRSIVWVAARLELRAEKNRKDWVPVWQTPSVGAMNTIAL